MKRYLAAFTIVLTLLCLNPPEVYAATDMKRSDGTTTWTTSGTTQVYAVSKAWKCGIRVKSAAGSTATVYIEGSMTADDSSWVRLATITDPDATGVYYGGPAPVFIRVNAASVGAGTLSARLDAQGPQGELF